MNSDMKDFAPPDGFIPHFRKSSLTNPWEPLYSKQTEDAVFLGLLVGNAHTNSRGFAHGGLITALADNAMGLSCALHVENLSGLVTAGLAIDFLGSAQIGQWLEIRPEALKAGRSISFVQCMVTADGVPCARGNATFSLQRKPLAA